MSWLPVVVTTEPASEPVSLAEAKAQCRVENGDNDTLLTSLIASSRTLVEAQTGTKFVAQTVSAKCSSWCDLKRLPTAPIQSVTSIKYLDTNGTEQTLDPSVYEAVLDGRRPLVRLKPQQSFPSTYCAPDAIRIVAVAGYTTVPQPVRAAMLLLISQWYDERSSLSSMRQSVTPDGLVPTLPNTVEALLANYRRP